MFVSQTKILIVDDMLTIRKIAKKMLVEINYKNVHEASDGLEAWNMITNEGGFELIIADWNMPKMNGLELLYKMKTDDILKHIPYVLLTAEADIEQVKEAIRSGVDNYILKPFSAESLKAKMDQTYQKMQIKRKAS